MKVIKRIIIFIILVVVFAGAILTYKGYTIYKQALDEISVVDKVIIDNKILQEIKNVINVTSLKTLRHFKLIFLYLKFYDSFL